MKKTAKGSYGYIRYQQKHRILVTAVMFLIPAVIFLTGYFQTGTRKNLFTVVAILGCLPASKSAVGAILICMQKPVDGALYRQLSEHAGDMAVIYDGVVSSYEKNMPMACMVISDTDVACLALDGKTDPAFAKKHMEKILRANQIFANVKVFTEVSHYLRRLDELREREAERSASEPERSAALAAKNQRTRQVLLAICV